MTIEYVQNMLCCDKCGSIMVPRKIATRKNKPLRFIDVLQCDVCRFWHER